MNKVKAFSLIEILLVIGIFTLTVTAMSVFSIDALRYIRSDTQRISSNLLIQEVANALILQKNDIWDSFEQHTGDGEKHLEFIDNKYLIAEGSEEKDGITLSFTINSVNRNDEGIIVESEGVLDPYTKRVDFLATWSDFMGVERSSNMSIYLNNWDVKRWKQTTTEDFNAGLHDFTAVETNDDGEVVLDTVFYPDWCEPDLQVNAYDVPGDATSRTVYGYPGFAYLGTRGIGSGWDPGWGEVGVAFTKLTVEGVDPPVVNVEGDYETYTVHDIFVEGDYAYLSTTSDDKELMIIDISEVPYQEVGYHNASGLSNGYSIEVKDDIAYLAQGRELISIDLSSKIGSRPEIDSINLAWWFGTIREIVIRGDYLYGALHNDWYELVIVDISDPYNLDATSFMSTNNKQTKDLYVTEDGNRAYFGTNESSYEDEFFIVNTEDKDSPASVVSSFDSGNTSVEGIAIVEDDEKAILVGINGEEYQVLDISDENNPLRCGGMHINEGIRDIDLVVDEIGNSFAYIMTGDSDRDFQIIRGGESLYGGGGGYGYASTGNFFSEIFNTETGTPNYFRVDWIEQEPEETNVSVQLRSASTQEGINSAIWVGPDGTNTTFFEDPLGELTPEDLDNKQYFQYRFILSTNSIDATPVAEEFTLYYEQ